MPSAWEAFKSSLEGELLTLNDTHDCGPARRQLSAAHIGEGGRLWAFCCMYRYFSNPSVWGRLLEAGAIRLHQRPPIDAARCDAVLRDAWDSEHPVFGPGRRALTLRWYIDAGGNYIVPGNATNKQRAARDTQCLLLFWQHRPAKQARSLLRCPSTEAFATLMDAWSETLRDKVGGFDQYFTKCVLDLFMPVSGLPDAVIGWKWPTHCPGYLEAAHVLVPGLPKEELMKFLLFIHMRPGPSTTKHETPTTKSTAEKTPTQTQQARRPATLQAHRRVTTFGRWRPGRSFAGGIGDSQGR